MLKWPTTLMSIYIDGSFSHLTINFAIIDQSLEKFSNVSGTYDGIPHVIIEVKEFFFQMSSNYVITCNVSLFTKKKKHVMYHSIFRIH